MASVLELVFRLPPRGYSQASATARVMSLTAGVTFTLVGSHPLWYANHPLFSVRLGGLGRTRFHRSGGWVRWSAFKLFLGSPGNANVTTRINWGPENQRCLKALLGSAVSSRLGWGDGLGNGAQYCWSVSQWNCLNGEYLKSRSVFERRRQKFLGGLQQRVFVSRDLHSWWASLQQ